MDFRFFFFLVRNVKLIYLFFSLTVHFEKIGLDLNKMLRRFFEDYKISSKVQKKLKMKVNRMKNHCYFVQCFMLI